MYRKGDTMQFAISIYSGGKLFNGLARSTRVKSSPNYLAEPKRLCVVWPLP